MRLLFPVTLTILLVGLILLGLGDTDITVTDTSVPDNEVASVAGKASNSSASVVITVTMAGTTSK